jgi:hypothetical protein
MFLGLSLCENYESKNVVLAKGKEKVKSFPYLVVYPLNVEKQCFRGFV